MNEINPQKYYGGLQEKDLKLTCFYTWQTKVSSHEKFFATLQENVHLLSKRFI